MGDGARRCCVGARVRARAGRMTIASGAGRRPGRARSRSRPLRRPRRSRTAASALHGHDRLSPRRRDRPRRARSCRPRSRTPATRSTARTATTTAAARATATTRTRTRASSPTRTSRSTTRSCCSTRPSIWAGGSQPGPAVERGAARRDHPLRPGRRRHRRQPQRDRHGRGRGQLGLVGRRRTLRGRHADEGPRGDRPEQRAPTSRSPTTTTSPRATCRTRTRSATSTTTSRAACAARTTCWPRSTSAPTRPAPTRWARTTRSRGASSTTATPSRTAPARRSRTTTAACGSTGMGHFGASYTENGGDNELVQATSSAASAGSPARASKSDCSGTVWSSFNRTILVNDINGPMGVDVAPDGKVYWTEIGPNAGLRVRGLPQDARPGGRRRTTRRPSPRSRPAPTTATPRTACSA